jgi:hypothetical protein
MADISCPGGTSSPHHVHEVFDRAADPFRDHDAGVVAGHDDDAADEVLDGNLIADIDETFGTRSLAPGALGDRELVGQLDAVILQPLEQEFQRHQLAHRGRRHRRVGIFLPQHLAGIGVHDHRMLGGGLDGFCRGGGGAKAKRQEKQYSWEAERPHERQLQGG